MAGGGVLARRQLARRAPGANGADLGVETRRQGPAGQSRGQAQAEPLQVRRPQGPAPINVGLAPRAPLGDVAQGVGAHITDCP